MSDNQLAVFLPGNRTAFEPGEVIHVTVLWAFDRAPASLEVRLFWRTRGKGSEDLEVVARAAVPASAAAGEHVCAFVLPAAPWSFSGKLVSLVWSIEAVARTPDQAASCDCVIAPGAAEILLHESANPPVPSV